MTPHRAQVVLQNGYDRGRDLCLTKGLEFAEVEFTRLHRLRHDPFRDGFAQALWDYRDANGIPQPADQPPF